MVETGAKGGEFSTAGRSSGTADPSAAVTSAASSPGGIDAFAGQSGCAAGIPWADDPSAPGEVSSNAYPKSKSSSSTDCGGVGAGAGGADAGAGAGVPANRSRNGESMSS